MSGAYHTTLNVGSQVARRTPDPDGVPPLLRRVPQWVCWRYATRTGEPVKVPINPRSGRLASVSDPRTWGTFEEALLGAEVRGGGIGFVLTRGDPFLLLDCDDCLDETGTVTRPEVEEILELLPSYTEVSPSGRGLHIILQTRLRPPRSRGPGVEVYFSGRFVCLTGQIFRGRSKLAMVPDERVRAFYDRFLGGRSPSGPYTPPPQILGGERNNRLTQMAGFLRRHGFMPTEISALLLQANRERCIPPLPDDEVRRIALGMQRYPPGEAGWSREKAGRRGAQTVEVEIEEGAG